jgi:hypothetical protein
VQLLVFCNSVLYQKNVQVGIYVLSEPELQNKELQVKFLYILYLGRLTVLNTVVAVLNYVTRIRIRIRIRQIFKKPGSGYGGEMPRTKNIIIF